MSAVGFDQVILFAGHMIDEPGRKEARFPARAENAARDALQNSIAVMAAKGGLTAGIAGGASGGDLLFHEVCRALAIPTLLRLALPVEKYIAASVAPAGMDWVRRFEALVERLGPGAIQVLDDSVVLPKWLTGAAELERSSEGYADDRLSPLAPTHCRDKGAMNRAPTRFDYDKPEPALNIWQRTNLWMVQEAIAIAPRRTLLALWDGKAGDGPGGTEHLVMAAPAFGVDVAPIIRTQTLFTAG